MPRAPGLRLGRYSAGLTFRVYLRLLTWIGACRFDLRALDALRKQPACIIAPNHLSWADPPAVRLAVKRRLWFMANDFLFRIPVMGPFIRYFGAFPVRRGVLDRDAIRKAEEHLQAGDLLCVFPEGGTTVL